MNYNIPFFQNPFFWIFLASLFMGMALAKMTKFTKKAKDPVKAKNRKWVLFCLYLTLSVILFTLAIFLPGKEKFFDIRLLYLAAGAVPAFFLIFRFKKAIGLPVMLLSIFLGISLILFFQSITAFSGETEVGTIRILDMSQDLVTLEITRPGHGGEIIEFEGEYISPVVKVILFDDWMVFLGAKTRYRFIGLSSFAQIPGEAIPQQRTRYEFENPDGISEELYNFFEKNEKSLPGVKSVQISMEMKRMQDLTLYRLLLQNDGTIQITAEVASSKQLNDVK